MHRSGTILRLSLLVLVSACESAPADRKADPELAGKSEPVAPAKPVAEPAPAASTSTPTVDIASAKADIDTWMLLTAQEHGFEARFPVAPKKEDMTVPSPVGTMPAVMYMAEQANDVVGVTVLSVPEAMLGGFDVNGGLDGGRDGMINNIGGTIVSEKQVKFLGHDAREIVAKASAEGITMKVEARLFWVSPRMYQLIAVSVDGAQSTPADRFFANFVLLE